MVKKIITLLLLFAVVGILPLSVHASGLDDAIGDMFDTSINSSDAYESQRRFGLVGGGYRARTPIRSIDIFNYAPPRFNAGCSGIDMFMGSFSFINMEQFTTLIRTIGANAVGYAFKTAVNAMCHECGAILADLQAEMNKLNQHLKNTCSVAQSIVDPLANPLTAKGEQTRVGGMLKTAAGHTTDLFSSINGLFEDNTSATDSDSEPEDNPFAGNVVWRALYGSDAADMIGSSADKLLTKQYLMSITGTYIIPTKAADSGYDDGKKAYNGTWIAPTLTLREIVSGNVDDREKIKYLNCADSTDGPLSCQDVRPQTFDFIGIKGYVNFVLFGYAKDPQDMSSTSVSGDSIVGIIQSGTGDFNSAQKAFFSIIKLPLLTWMLQVQQDPGAVQQIAITSAPLIIDQLAISLGGAVYRATASAFTGQDIPRPKEYQHAIAGLRQDLDYYHTQAAKEYKVINEITTMVKNVRNYMSGSVM